MKGKALKLSENPLLSGSLFMVVGSNAANIIAFIYHFILGRMLGSSAYGELASIISVISLSSVGYTACGVVVVKFISSVLDHEERRALSIWSRRIFVKLSLIGSALLIILSPIIASFLHIRIIDILISSPVFLLSALVVFDRSILQGVLKFRESVTSVVLEVTIRLISSIIFVILGGGSAGATLGFLVGVFFSYIYVHRLANSYTQKSTKTFTRKNDVINFFIPIFIQTLALTSFFSMDLLLAKHFLNQIDAGLYASLSALGKIVFYGVSPVALVMFPIVSGKHASGQKHGHVFLTATLVTSVLLAGILVIYALIPQVPVRILFGDKFIDASQYLFAYGSFIAIFTLSNQMISYFFSTGLTRSAIPYSLCALFQVIGIVLFHSSIWEIIHVCILSGFLLFVSMLIYGYNSIWRKQ